MPLSLLNNYKSTPIYHPYLRIIAGKLIWSRLMVDGIGLLLWRNQIIGAILLLVFCEVRVGVLWRLGAWEREKLMGFREIRRLLLWSFCRFIWLLLTQRQVCQKLECRLSHQNSIHQPHSCALYLLIFQERCSWGYHRLFSSFHHKIRFWKQVHNHRSWWSYFHPRISYPIWDPDGQSFDYVSIQVLPKLEAWNIWLLPQLVFFFVLLNHSKSVIRRIFYFIRAKF